MAESLLKLNIISQAKYFLDNMDEFYPFGAVVDNLEAVKPISFYNGDEFPSSKLIIGYLEKIIIDGIQNSEYLSGAIGIDILIKLEGEEKNAIEIREYSAQGQSISRVEYFKKDEQYFFHF